MANNNLGFVMTIKATDGTLVPLYPQTIKDQVVGWNIGEVFGPYQLTLLASEWNNNQQLISLDGVTPNDILICNQILSGTQEEMINQKKSYELLDSLIGIESLQNQIKFTCVATPVTDFSVAIHWTR